MHDPGGPMQVTQNFAWPHHMNVWPVVVLEPCFSRSYNIITLVAVSNLLRYICTSQRGTEAKFMECMGSRYQAAVKKFTE